MVNNRNNARRQLDRLADALANEVDSLSDEQVLREAAESYGSVDKAVEDIKAGISAAISASGKRRLLMAREAYDKYVGKAGSKIVQLPLDRKRALLERFAGSDTGLREKLTFAARNEKASESDIDSLLEDLIELGVIDDEGNVK